MKIKMMIGTLVLGLGLCSQSFGNNLLDRMLGSNGCGCETNCCTTSCCKPKCRKPKCCEPVCAPKCCVVADPTPCCAAPAPSCGCDAAPSCGCENSCCKQKKCPRLNHFFHIR